MLNMAGFLYWLADISTQGQLIGIYRR